MGGRSKSSSNTNPKPVDTGAVVDKGASQQERSFGGAQQGYGNLQTAMIGQIFPAFGEMVGGAMKSFGQHPMGNIMGAAFGLPIQMETPEFAQKFIDKYRPQEPAAPAQQAPQQPAYNINDDMRARMGMVTPYGQYGQYGPQRNSMFGGVGR